VRLVLRPPSDADTAHLAAFSDDVKAALDLAMAREGMVTGMTDQEAVDAIERLPGGLGTASMALLLSEGRRATPLAIDGVEPTLANVASGRYPHAKTMTLVYGPDATPAARKFIAFVTSEPGRKLLAEMGHLPPPPAPRTAWAVPAR
jgi:phosphate transport system substrate-binding protein